MNTLTTLRAEITASINALKKAERLLLSLEKHEPEAYKRTLERIKPGRPTVTKKKPPEQPSVAKTPIPEAVPQTLPALQPKEKEMSIGQFLVVTYCDEFKVFKKTHPHVLPQHAKALKTFGEQVGRDQAARLIKHFFSMKDSWFETKGYDIPTFLGNLNKIKVSFDTGEQVTKKQAAGNERDAHNERMMQKALGMKNARPN